MTAYLSLYWLQQLEECLFFFHGIITSDIFRGHMYTYKICIKKSYKMLYNVTCNVLSSWLLSDIIWSLFRSTNPFHVNPRILTILYFYETTELTTQRYLRYAAYTWFYVKLLVFKKKFNNSSESFDRSFKFLWKANPTNEVPWQNIQPIIRKEYGMTGTSLGRM